MTRRYSIPWLDFGGSPISTVVVSDDGTVHLAGIVAQDIVAAPERPLESVAAKKTAERETLLILGAVRDVLAALHMEMSDITSCLVHLSDLNDFESMNAAFRLHFGAAGPARTTVQAAKLVLGARVELTVVAKRPRHSVFPCLSAAPLPPGEALTLVKK